MNGRLYSLRNAGWRVAVHNEYRLKGKDYTFWLLTKGDLCAKGEGRDDDEALKNVEAEVSRIMQYKVAPQRPRRAE